VPDLEKPVIPAHPETSTAELLALSRSGDRVAFDTLYTRLYDDLQSAARGQLRHRSGGATLDTTGLVHEAYIRLVDETGVPWACRAHFLGVAARAMRRAIVDYVRERTARKRGGGVAHVTLVPDLVGIAHEPEILIGIDDALSAMAQFNDRLSRVAECRLFGGMSEEETAAALDVSVRTVQRDWQRARAWLQAELSG
jgi:RNA polymerase sigma-70 factor, ECF subfamily